MAVFIVFFKKTSEILISDSLLSSFILMYHRVCKINKVIMEARSMDKKKVIKFMINVLPIVLVPLIVERKRIKQHPDVQKVTDATSKVASKTSAAISNTASDLKEYVGDKKQDFENKRELKKFAREHDPAYIEKKGEKLAKQNRKDADKMNKILQKNIEKRHKEEQKAREKNEIQRIKDMKKTQKYEEKAGLTPNKLDEKTEKKGDKLAEKNRKEIAKMNKKLQKNIEKRHKEEQKRQQEADKARIKSFKKYKDYVAKSASQQNKENNTEA